jgi:hypothetical protein
MRDLVLVLAAVVALSACKKEEKDETGSKQAASGKKSDLVKNLEAQAEAACACKDFACAEGVLAAVKKLADGTTAAAIPEADLPALQTAQASIDRCTGALHPKIVEYGKLAEEVCACGDKACAEKVSGKFKAWADEVRSKKIAIPGGMGAILVPGTQAKKCLDNFGLEVPQ